MNRVAEVSSTVRLDLLAAGTVVPGDVAVQPHSEWMNFRSMLI